MNIRILTVPLFLLFLAGYVSIFSSYEKVRRDIQMEEVKGITFPPAIVKLLSLEYRNIAADLLFIRVSQFYGGRIETLGAATEEDWGWFYRNLNVITELDPYFQDTYYLGNAILTWDAGMHEEAAHLLEKAVKARYWDWNFPFFMGFNKFFFLKDYKGGADYLLMAYKRPGAWGGLPSLAARLYYKNKRTETAIAFLSKIWLGEKNPSIKKYYATRLEALTKILYLEKAVDVYVSRIGVPPPSLKSLIDARIVEEIPVDPYGGEFYLDKEGEIKSTSKLARMREKKK